MEKTASQEHFYQVSRPPLMWEQGLNLHWGIAVQDPVTRQTWVWHNTPEKGEHWGTIEEFAAGLEYHVSLLPDTEEIRARLARATANPKPYDLIARNCQQTVTEVIDGFPWTPALWAGLGIGAAIYLLTRR